MELQHEHKTYPPNVTITIYSNGPISRKAEFSLDVEGMGQATPPRIRITRMFTAGIACIADRRTKI